MNKSIVDTMIADVVARRCVIRFRIGGIIYVDDTILLSTWVIYLCMCACLCMVSFCVCADDIFWSCINKRGCVIAAISVLTFSVSNPDGSGFCVKPHWLIGFCAKKASCITQVKYMTISCVLVII